MRGMHSEIGLDSVSENGRTPAPGFEGDRLGADAVTHPASLVGAGSGILGAPYLRLRESSEAVVKARP